MTNVRNFLTWNMFAVIFGSPAAAADDRPNILWLTSEDNSISCVSCYGATNCKTPTIDQLAAAGFRDTHCLLILQEAEPTGMLEPCPDEHQQALEFQIQRLSPNMTLRSRAEAFLAANPQETPVVSTADTRELVHELRVHEIQLEMQNEELRRAIGELEQSRDAYAELYDFAPVGYLTLDRGGMLRHANLAAATVLGVACSRLVGRAFSEFVPPDARNEWRRHYAHLLARNEQRRIELSLCTATEAAIRVALECCPRPGSDDESWHCVIAMIDVTERKRAEETLRASEGQFRTLFEQAPIGIGLVAPDGKPVCVNRALQHMLGYTEEELCRGHFIDWTHPDDVQASLEIVQRLRRGEADHLEIEKRYLCKHGKVVWAHTAVSAVRDERGEVRCFIAMVEDINERKRAERELRESREQLRGLVARLHRAQEEERIRIAREVHDELGQLLTGLKMVIRRLEEKLSEPDLPPECRSLLDRAVDASELTDATIACVQKIAAELRPEALDRLGLAATLTQTARKFQERTGIPCTATVPEQDPELGPGAASELFYICREALTNVARHACATAAEIRLGSETAAVVLEIGDNGIGLPGIESGAPEGLGLLGMRERARHCGGQVSFQQNDPRGTLVRVWVPRDSSEPGGTDTV